MNLTQALASIGAAVNDSEATKYPLAVRVQALDEQNRKLFRDQTEGNPELHNFTFAVSASDARALFQGVYEYRLPTWVKAVITVWQRQASLASAADEFSPYNWATSDMALDAEIPKAEPGHRGLYWSWEGHHTMRLVQATQAEHLAVRCAKYPPRLFRAKISTVHTDTTKLILPATLEVGGLDLERGSYANAEIQVVSTVDPSSSSLGQIRRVVDSDAAAVFSGSRAHVLKLDAELTLAAGDVVETMLPIDEGHTRYLVLRVLEQLFTRQANLAGMRAIAHELQEERVNFLRFASPSRDGGPRFYSSRSSRTQSRDPDRAAWPFYP